MIDFTDFLTIIQPLLLTRNPREELEERVKLFEDDGTGRVTFKNLKDVGTGIGEQITKHEIIEITAEADRTGDGDITPEEFINVIQDSAIF